MGPDRGRQAMAAIGLLADELRQRLYRFVAAQPRPVTWDQAAAAAGISRKLAASTSTSWSPGCWRGTAVRWDRDDGRRFAFLLLACVIVCFNQL